MKIKAPDEGLARRLQQAGVLIEVEERADTNVSDDGLLIQQWGGVIESAAIAYRKLVTLITLNLAITVDRTRFAISGFDLELPWAGWLLWLPDPRELGLWRDYHFGFEGIPDFERDQVLNHFADERRMISCGRTLRGSLLGIYDPIPDVFQHGAEIPAFIIISDQFFRKYRRPVSLCADRMRAPIDKSLAPRRNLWDRKDAVPLTMNRDWIRPRPAPATASRGSTADFALTLKGLKTAMSQNLASRSESATKEPSTSGETVKPEAVDQGQVRSKAPEA